MAAEVIVYTKNMCPYCVRAKALLDKRGIAYEDINLSSDPDRLMALVEETGMMTLPQVMIDGKLLGGYDETAAADRSGQLAELIGA
ncbi:MAG TPA: glutaredoxin domain-containing protein [Baekduia sp.]|nr:glutaredoxin domain-containing protein [Baekduia sp.]